MNRRHFVLTGASAAALSACAPAASRFSPGVGTAPEAMRATQLYTRMEINAFANDATLLAAYRRGVKAMMAIKDPTDVRSWDFWHNSHWMATGTPPPQFAHVWNQCKHHRKPFFYAWHRALLYFFEKQLRLASGHSGFALPYWDYYANPQLPVAFTQQRVPGGGLNPLFWPGRKGTVMEGLSYQPFHRSVKVFPNSQRRGFEWLFEPNPHGRVHDLVGGDMGEVPTAAADPIFWAHHSNVDRLWSAWLAAGQGRHMPPAGHPYYDHTFAFNLAGTWKLSVGQMTDSTKIGYTFSDLSLPKPPATAAVPARPGPGTLPLALALAPVTLEANAGKPATTIVLEGVELTALGRAGGFAVDVYANLPGRPVPIGEEPAYLAGSFGSFEISAAKMEMPGMAASPSGAVDLRFDLPETVNGNVAVSLVPLGENRGGDLVRIAGVRLE